MINYLVSEKGKTVRRALGLGLATLVICTLAIGAFPGSASAAVKWYDSAWKFRKQITIIHTLVAHDLAEFPVLISLPDDKNLAEKALKHGEDILFTGDDGITRLSHEIEYYLTDSGNLIAWVNMPYLSAEKDTDIFMYYGNPESPDQQDPKGTWNKDFSMIQHLEETEGGIDFDSTGNGNGGTYNGDWQDAKGIIDGADGFNGSSYNVRIPHAESLSFTADFTLEAWVNPAQVPQWTRRIISKEGEYILQINGNFVFFVPGVGDVTSTTAPAKDTWTHVAAVFRRGSALTPNTLELYINGKLESSFTGYGTPTNTKNSLYLASGEGMHYLDGVLDEVRISGTTRPKEWLETAYDNQAKPEAFYKVGEEEVQIAAPAVRTDEANPVGMMTATLRGFLTWDGGESTSCRFIWDTENTFPHPTYTPWVSGYRTGQSFNVPLSGLNKATHYYYRAQASNSGGMVSGGILFVLTRPDPPADGSFTAADISDTRINLTWQKGATAQKTMVRAGTNGYPASVTEGRQAYFDTGTSCTDIGLNPGTTYYYRAWSQVSGSEQFSETFIEITVTTLGGGGPVVTVGGDIYAIDKIRILFPYLVTGLVLAVITVFGGIKIRKNYCRARTSR